MLVSATAKKDFRGSSSEPRSWIKPYYASFDGLRAIAITAVFICHYGYLTGLQPSLWWTGVDLFFVLSGFLITGILYESTAQPRFFRNFYIRRALRILPLYYGLFLALAAARLVYKHQLVPGLWIDLLFLQNIFLRAILLGHIVNVTVFSMGHRYIQFGPLWSLCVEEQFYALWPLCVFLIRSRRALLRLCIFGIAAVLLLRCSIYLLDPVAQKTGYLYYEPYSRFDSLLIGAALNLWLRGMKLRPIALRRISWILVTIGSALLGATVLAFGMTKPVRETNPAIQSIGLTLIAVIAAGCILLSLDDESLFARLLRLKPLKRLGKISYGFYFFHFFLLPFGVVIARHLNGLLKPLVLPIMFMACYVVAFLSFRFWESPFLRLKARLAPSGHASIPRAAADLR